MDPLRMAKKSVLRQLQKKMNAMLGQEEEMPVSGDSESIVDVDDSVEGMTEETCDKCEKETCECATKPLLKPSMTITLAAIKKSSQKKMPANLEAALKGKSTKKA